MHHHETLCGRLLPSVLRVSEKNSSRKLAEQPHYTRIRSNRITLGVLDGALRHRSKLGQSPAPLCRCLDKCPTLASVVRRCSEWKKCSGGALHGPHDRLK